MPHIHTEPGHHDLTVSAYVFRTDGEKARVVLHWHKKINRWMQFGGHVELHETPWATITHELRDESGYELSQLRLLQPPHRLTAFGDSSVMHPLPFVFGTHPFDGKIHHFHTNLDYLFTTNQAPRHQPAAEESTKIRLFTKGELESLPTSEVLQNVKTAALLGFDLLGQWQPVDPLQYSQASPPFTG